MAPAVLRVVREEARIELAEAAAARRARALHGEDLRLAPAPSFPAHVQHALAHLERLVDRVAKRLLVLGRDVQLGDRQLDGVLAEAVQARPALRRQVLAVHAQMRHRLRERPFREVGVEALAVGDERREHGDGPAALLLHEARDDGLGALRLDRHVASGAELRAQLHEEKPQEVVDLGLRGHRALRPAAARALLDRHRGRNAEDRVHVRLGRRLHELARVGVQRFEVAALSLGEKDVEGERGLSGPGNARDHREFPTRDLDVDPLQVVLARVAHGDGVGAPLRLEVGDARFGHARRERFLVLAKRLAGVRSRVRHELLRRAGRDDLAARVTAFGAQVHDPVAGADHIQVVLDDDERVARGHELAERAQQLRHVIEVQSGGRLVEEEEASLPSAIVLRPAREHRDRLAARFGEVARELQALRLAAGERRHRLAQSQVVEAHVHERTQRARDLVVVPEGRDGLGYGELEHVGDAAPVDLHLEHFVAVARAVAVRAAQVDIRQELHLHVLESVAAARGAAAIAGVEAECARGVTARPRVRRFREQRADGIERAHVARGVRTRGAADGRLVHEHDVVHVFGSGERAECAGRFGGLAQALAQRRMQDVLDQRGFPRSRDARHAHEPAQREIDVDVLQVVLGGAADAELLRAAKGVARKVVRHFHARHAHFGIAVAVVGALATGQVLRGERRGRLQFVGRAEEYDLAAALAGAGPHVEELVGFQHDLWVVLHHDERVARVAQALHHVDHAAHVARVQPDGGLVQHEERIHERGAERGGEVDALHFAARERARLAVEREVAQPHFAQVAQARADLAHQQLGRLVERLGQLQLAEEFVQMVHRDQHQGAQVHAVHAPEQGLGLQPRAAARRARRVRAVARQEHADVHLVRLGLEPVEEALHAIPVRLARLLPAHPVGVALHHPALVLLAQIAIGHVERHAALRGHLLQVVLALVIALRLERLDRAIAQRLRLVGDDEPVVDADHAAEAAARIAGADGRVEREARGRRIRVVDVAIGAMQVGGESPCLAVFLPEDIHAALSHPQRGLDGLDHARLLPRGHLHAVLRDFEPRALAPVDARVALGLQQLGDFLFGEVRRHVDGKRDHQARIARGRRAIAHLGEDRLGRVAAHGLVALAAEELRGAREEQLQMIVDLRHRPDRRARRAHGIGLVDGDGRRDSLDRIDLRLVHAVEELARVGRERLDIAALSLGVEGVEHERRLSGT